MMLMMIGTHKFVYRLKILVEVHDMSNIIFAVEYSSCKYNIIIIFRAYGDIMFDTDKSCIITIIMQTMCINSSQ